MTFQHKRRSKPGFDDGHGEHGEPVEERPTEAPPAAMGKYSIRYPGYEPQRYVMPIPSPDVHEVHGEVQNNVDRGDHWHGEDEDLAGAVHDKDVASPSYNHGLVDQVYPEHVNNDYCPPVKVEVVGRDTITKVVSSFYRVRVQPAAVGQHGAILVLPEDDKRTFARIAVTPNQDGSLVFGRGDCLVTNSSDVAGSGYSISAFQVNNGVGTSWFDTRTTSPMWLAMDPTATQSYYVDVFIERTINADPYRAYPMAGDERY
jgi:hypothetical protein